MAQRRRLRPSRMSILRCLLTCALVTVTTVALLSGHVLPSSKAPSSSGINKLSKRWNAPTEELRWTQELSPPQLSKFIDYSRSRKLDGSDWATSAEFEKLWKAPLSRGFVPCVAPGSSYLPPGESRGYLLVHANGGLNQMKAGISDMVVVARLLNATLVIPKLDKNSFWQDTSKFADVFDEEHFLASLVNDIKIVKKLPLEFAKAKRAVKYFTSWSSVDYYQREIFHLWNNYQVIRAAKSDARLANNNLPPEIQKLRCRAFYEALRFAPPIEALGKLLVDRMKSFGPYIALHLRYEKDMLAFSGCTYGLSEMESDELTAIRENITYWKVKEIDPLEQRARGYCPLTPKEVGVFLSSLGYPSNTPIYIAAGEIYGGQTRMADLESRYPILMSKEKLASEEELRPFSKYASQMAALDYIVSVESNVFIPSYSGNMARAVEGHRRFLGHRKTIIPDRKALVHLFDKVDHGQLREGPKLSDRITEIHRRRQGSPRKRKGAVPGTRGRERFRSEEVFYENPLPDCLCQSSSSDL
ncbi:GDP-fucose protein O-fucosyltransferase [Carex littledalei]|uniref:O-fucosyltransferase family protein n=1 Tax=Carex littledalei TaxID=544730 RepID=A0A833RKQ2_9POAL|nr:GDP-fucose protein O-fucosyltransferase [Carex littledalei]